MHGKNLALTLTLALLVVGLVPVPSAGHTTTARYDVPSGPSGNLGIAASTRPCAEEWRDWDGSLGSTDDEDPVRDAAEDALTFAATTGCQAVDPEGDGVVRIGVYSAALEPHDGDDMLTFTAHDDHFDSTYIRVVEVDDALDGWGESVAGCGTVTLGFSEWSYPQITVYASFVDPDDLEVCLGSSGTVETDHVA